MATTKTRKNTKKNKGSALARVGSFLQQKRKLVIVAVFVVIGVTALVRSFATPNYWMPTADKPLTLTWILGDISRLTPEQVLQQQTKTLGGATIPQADVNDIDGEYATKAHVDYLHSKGKKVICYFDAGVYEDYRSDKDKFPKSVIGSADEGWDGSYWLDIRQIAILEPIMKARIQMCKDKGFDSIEPDEITNWSNSPGFPITYQDQIKYNRALAGWAHEAGLSIGLKGDLEQAHDLVNDFDWTLNEECYQYDECTTINNSGGPGADGKDYPGLQLFVQKNKAVWVAEYTKVGDTQACTDSVKNKFNTAWYKLGLPVGSGRTDCPPFASTTPNPTPVVNPTVGISSSSSSLTAPANFTITATSSIDSTIDITLNGTVLKSCTTAKTCSVSPANYQQGTYTFAAKATTGQGGSGSSTTTVTVKAGTTAPANVAPTVSISTTSPTTLTAPAAFTVSAQAADSDGSVASLQFYLNGSATGAAQTKAPYSLNLSNYQAGTYKFTAKATDNSGAVSAASNTITFTVNAAPTPPVPTVSLPDTPVLGDSTLSYRWWNGGCSYLTDCSLTLTWQPVSNASSYELRRGTKVLGTSLTTSFVDKPVNGGFDYSYEIYAKNSAGYSVKPAKVTKTISCGWIFCGIN